MARCGAYLEVPRVSGAVWDRKVGVRGEEAEALEVHGLPFQGSRTKHDSKSRESFSSSGCSHVEEPLQQA